MNLVTRVKHATCVLLNKLFDSFCSVLVEPAFNWYMSRPKFNKLKLSSRWESTRRYVRRFSTKNYLLMTVRCTTRK